MRLTSFERDTIKKLAKKYFGSETRIYLFGSRVYDDKKGGDVDLFLRNAKDTSMNLELKIQFLAELKKNIGNRKIDLVFDKKSTKRKHSFYASILNESVEL